MDMRLIAEMFVTWSIVSHFAFEVLARLATMGG